MSFEERLSALKKANEDFLAVLEAGPSAFESEDAFNDEVGALFGIIYALEESVTAES